MPAKSRVRLRRRVLPKRARCPRFASGFLRANLGSERFSPAEGQPFKPYTPRYFAPILFLLSIITLRRIRLIRVW
jgi:hypothetical protein